MTSRDSSDGVPPTGTENAAPLRFFWRRIGAMSDCGHHGEGEHHGSGPQALAIAVAEAQQLLLHTVRHALPVPDEVLRSVIAATREADLERWTDDEKTQFWKSAQALAKIVQPASSDSISRTTADSGKHTTVFYSFMALALLVALIVTQIFWVFGTTMTSNIDRLIDANNKAETELLAAQARLSVARAAAVMTAGAQPGTTISAQNDIDLDKAVALNQILIKQNGQILTADYILLDRWVSWMPVGFTASASNRNRPMVHVEGRYCRGGQADRGGEEHQEPNQFGLGKDHIEGNVCIYSPHFSMGGSGQWPKV